MKACLDVDYRDEGAVAACVAFSAWADAAPALEVVERIAAVAEYEPGAFYKRELPCLLAVLARLPAPPSLVVVDGFVWLEDESRPGLGARLFDALGGTVPVVGGESATRPLWVTAAGMDAKEAAEAVKGMHGPHRLPTLIKRVDVLCRSGFPA
ncbi:MAG: endonuclease V [Gemmataceae bacterium]|nr:endonuclease V [Gemmataceae bacterium]